MNKLRLSEKGAERLSISFLLTPAIAIIVLLFLGGLVSGLLRSLNYFPLIGLTDFNFDAYFSIFTDNGFLQSLVLTFHIAFTSTLIASVLAVASALLLRPAFHQSGDTPKSLPNPVRFTTRTGQLWSASNASGECYD